MEIYKDIQHFTPQKILIKTHVLYAPGEDPEKAYTGDTKELVFILNGNINVTTAAWIYKYIDMDAEKLTEEESVTFLREFVLYFLKQDLRYKKKITDEWIEDNLSMQDMADIIKVFMDAFGRINSNPNF